MREPCHSAPECTRRPRAQARRSGARERAVVRGAEVVQDRHEQAFELRPGAGAGARAAARARAAAGSARTVGSTSGASIGDRWLRSPLSGLDLDRFGLGGRGRASAPGLLASQRPVFHQPESRARNPSRGAGRRSCGGMSVPVASGLAEAVCGRGRGCAPAREPVRAARAPPPPRPVEATVSWPPRVRLGRDRDLRAPPGGRELHCAAYKRALPGDGGLGLHPGDAHLTERGQPSGEGLRVADLRPEFGRGLHEGALRTGLGHDDDGFGTRPGSSATTPILQRRSRASKRAQGTRKPPACAQWGDRLQKAPCHGAICSRSVDLEPAARRAASPPSALAGHCADRNWGVIDAWSALLALGFSRIGEFGARVASGHLHRRHPRRVRGRTYRAAPRGPLACRRPRLRSTAARSRTVSRRRPAGPPRRRRAADRRHHGTPRHPCRRRASSSTRRRRLAPVEFTVHSGVPVTTVSRTLADLAAVLVPATSSAHSSAPRHSGCSTLRSVLASVEYRAGRRRGPRASSTPGTPSRPAASSRWRCCDSSSRPASRGPGERQTSAVRGRPALAAPAASSPRPTASAST